MKVAFFVENKSQEGADIRRIAEENPGFAATSYLFYLMAHLLTFRDNGISVTLITTHPMVMADGISATQQPSLAEAYRWCRQNSIDYLVVKHAEKYVSTICTQQAGTRFIVWCHNFVSFSHLTLYARSNAVARLICVGREQADIYRDHRAFRKTDWIYNCVDNYLFHIPADAVTPAGQRQPVVTYIGAVIPGKGFHLLARAWKKVLHAEPRAQLYVVGNGKLYGDNIEMGPWQLAEKNYESSFIHYLTDNQGRLLPSVHLMGILGREKYDILAKTKVGVPNPSGLTETFCNSGVEMQLMGAVIASRRCTGYMDTVKNGRLTDNPNLLADAIVACLHDTSDNYAETRRAIEHNFTQGVAVSQWEKLFNEALPQGKRLCPLQPLVNAGYELKWLKERIRIVKEQHPWLYSVLPSLGFFTEAWKALKWAVWKRTQL